MTITTKRYAYGMLAGLMLAGSFPVCAKMPEFLTKFGKSVTDFYRDSKTNEIDKRKVGGTVAVGIAIPALITLAVWAYKKFAPKSEETSAAMGDASETPVAPEATATEPDWVLDMQLNKCAHRKAKMDNQGPAAKADWYARLLKQQVEYKKTEAAKAAKLSCATGKCGK